VLLHVRPAIAQIISSCPFIDQIIKKGDNLPTYDYYVLSEHIHLTLNTTFKTIPADIPYLFAKPELIQKWKSELDRDKKFKVGICWKCQTYVDPDTKQPIPCERNIPLQTLCAISQ